jgi:hypothetical protein
MGIGCNNEWRPQDWVLRGFRQFDAPVSIGVTFNNEHADIPSDQVIMIWVSMGYPDASFPANAVVSQRRPAIEVASFVVFEAA